MNTRPHPDNLFVDETQLIHQKVTQIVQVIRPTFNPDCEHNKAIIYILLVSHPYIQQKQRWVGGDYLLCQYAKVSVVK